MQEYDIIINFPLSVSGLNHILQRSKVLTLRQGRRQAHIYLPVSFPSTICKSGSSFAKM